MDDNAEKLGRQKMRSDAIKRQFAIQGMRNILHHPRVGLNLQLQTTSVRRRRWLRVPSATAKMTPYPKLRWSP